MESKLCITESIALEVTALRTLFDILNGACSRAHLDITVVSGLI